MYEGEGSEPLFLSSTLSSTYYTARKQVAATAISRSRRPQTPARVRHHSHASRGSEGGLLYRCGEVLIHYRRFSSLSDRCSHSSGRRGQGREIEGESGVPCQEIRLSELGLSRVLEVGAEGVPEDHNGCGSQ